MRRNMMGEPQAEPGDDLSAVFSEAFPDEIEEGDDEGPGAAGEELETERSTIEHAEHMGGWNCTVRDSIGNELTVRGFDTREALEGYLAAAKVKLVD